MLRSRQELSEGLHPETHRSKRGRHPALRRGIGICSGCRTSARDLTGPSRIPVFTCWRTRPDDSRTSTPARGSRPSRPRSPSRSSRSSASPRSFARSGPPAHHRQLQRLRATRNTLDPATSSSPSSAITPRTPSCTGWRATTSPAARKSSCPRRRSTIPSTATRGSSTAPTPTASPRETPSRRPSSTP